MKFFKSAGTEHYKWMCKATDTIEPTRDYQPTGKDRYARWHHKQEQAEP